MPGREKAESRDRSHFGLFSLRPQRGPVISLRHPQKAGLEFN